MKRFFEYSFFICFLLFLLLFPEESAESAKSGLMLWFYTLLPSMLPFMILSGILMKAGFIEKVLSFTKGFWKSVFHLSPMGGYGLLMGIFCGYPMGAKTAADLYQCRRISRQEACYLLSFSSHPGPAFLSSYLCAGLLHNKQLILPSYILLYFSSFLSSLLFRRLYPSDLDFQETSNRKETSSVFSLGEALDASIMNSFVSITKLGGYIILFSLFQGILKMLPYPPPDLKCLLLGFTEITTGTMAITERNWKLSLSYPLTLAFTAFGGLCIIFQTKSMLNDTDLPLTPYLKGKCCSFFLTLILGTLFIKIIEIIV